MSEDHPVERPRPSRAATRRAAPLLLALTLAQCNGQPEWQAAQTAELRGSLMAVWGTSARDVYFVGGDGQGGPAVVHFDGASWRRLATGQAEGELWWLHGAAPDTVFMVGARGMILRYNPQTRQFARMTSPTTRTLFGVWGASAADVWAVGGSRDETGTVTEAVLLHYDGSGDAWQDVTATLPAGASTGVQFFKVWGRAANDVWVVGEQARLLHYDGAAWTLVPPPTIDAEGNRFSRSLRTVHGDATRHLAVGGSGTAGVLEGRAGTTEWQDVSRSEWVQLNGVFVPATGPAVAVGNGGTVMRRTAEGWQLDATGPVTDLDFHAVWIDPDGGVWAAGGDWSFRSPSTEGMIWHFGARVPMGPTADM